MRPTVLGIIQQLELGWNYRLTDIQAALGLSQLERLAQFVEKRRALAARYDALLQNLPLICPFQHPDGQSAFHLYVVCLKTAWPEQHRRVFEGLRACGIGVNLHYIPVHLQPYYTALGFGPGAFPNSEAYYQSAITLPLYPGLTEEAQDQVVAALGQVLDE